jgi:hypothetical protein
MGNTVDLYGNMRKTIGMQEERFTIFIPHSLFYKEM